MLRVRFSTQSVEGNRVSTQSVGTRKYDYGKYEVEISSRNGEVKVDYDD